MLKQWDWIRVLRLVMGVAILIEALVLKDFFIGLAGVLLTAMPILNIGCCGVAACSVPKGKITTDKKEISYEEIN